MKPMLAARADNLADLKYPLLVSPKLDGIRVVIKEGVVLSRSLKAIPNSSVQEVFGKYAFDNLDGEIIAGPPTAPNVFNRTTRFVMKADAREEEWALYAFDYIVPTTFANRYKDLGTFANLMTRSTRNIPLRVVEQREVANASEAMALYQQYMEEGYEGIMLRKPESPYKHGRSTLREAALIKYKAFLDDEAEVVGAVELMHNDNVATKDNLGHTKRSSAKAGKRGANMLGTLVVRTPRFAEFELGTGFTETERIDFWRDRALLIGKIVKFKYFEPGTIDKPRFPVFLGFRDERDMS